MVFSKIFRELSDMFGYVSRAVGCSAFAAGRCLSEFIGPSNPSRIVNSFLGRKCAIKAVEFTVGMVLDKLPASELVLGAMGTNRQSVFEWGCTNLRSSLHGLVTPVLIVPLNMLRASVDYQLPTIASDMSKVELEVQAYNSSEDFDERYLVG